MCYNQDCNYSIEYQGIYYQMVSRLNFCRCVRNGLKVHKCQHYVVRNVLLGVKLMMEGC